MGSHKKPPTEAGKPETQPPTENHPGPETDPSESYRGESYPSARFIHGAFHPRDFADEAVIAEPGE